MRRTVAATMIAGACALAGLPAAATDCGAWPMFSSSEDYLERLSVPAASIGEHLSASEYSEGIRFSSEMRGDELWVDITHYPGQTTAAGGPRAVMMIGRLVDESFTHLVLADGGEGKFKIAEPDLRAVGCRFIWGREGGENSVALLRELYPQTSWYGSGAPISTAWNGSLMGDTMLAINIGTEILMPEWAMSAVK